MRDCRVFAVLAFVMMALLALAGCNKEGDDGAEESCPACHRSSGCANGKCSVVEFRSNVTASSQTENVYVEVGNATYKVVKDGEQPPIGQWYVLESSVRKEYVCKDGKCNIQVQLAPEKDAKWLEPQKQTTPAKSAPDNPDKSAKPKAKEAAQVETESFYYNLEGEKIIVLQRGDVPPLSGKFTYGEPSCQTCSHAGAQKIVHVSK